MSAVAAAVSSVARPRAVHAVDVSSIDPIMFAQYLADEAKLCAREDGTLRFTLMIASALIADLAVKAE